MAANSAMVRLYWDIGRTVLDRQEREGWGAKVIDRLSVDLRAAYPEHDRGFSPRISCSCGVSRGVSGRPESETARFTIAVAARHRSPRAGRAIRRRDFGTCGQSLRARMDRTLSCSVKSTPAPTRAAGTRSPTSTRRCLLVTRILAAAGVQGSVSVRFSGHRRSATRAGGRTSAGRSHSATSSSNWVAGSLSWGVRSVVELAGRDFFLDLLFYHLGLRCFVVVELKAVAFEPGFVGQMNALSVGGRRSVAAPSRASRRSVVLLCRSEGPDRRRVCAARSEEADRCR